MIELKQVIKKEQKDKKDVVTTIRTTKQNKEWLDNHNISPTLLFNTALEEIMKEKKWRKLENENLNRN